MDRNTDPKSAVSLGKQNSVEACTPEVASPERGILKVCFAEIRALEIWTMQTSASENNLAQMISAQLKGLLR